MSVPNLREELAEICDALHIQSPTALTFRGESPVWAYAPGPAAAPADRGAAVLLETLRNLLYGTCYTRPSPAAMPSTNLLPALMQANQSRDRWSPGWVIYQLGGDGRISAQKGERSRAAVVGEYATGKAPGVPPRVGDSVHLRVCPSFERPYLNARSVGWH